ncbi:glycosyltransferase [Serratia microhaemolytica]|uniref:glycosyltransferase n=1 Tax=Serratia microhaemolytica TaxID=2675110 RepID=UPI000FDF1EA1|nr:glycosyltransferase [Serratia microhaemolytica]
MKQHILFIIDGLPGGGAEKVTLILAKGISERGYQVTLLSLNQRRDYDIPEGVDYLVDDDVYQGPLRRWQELKRRAASLDRKLSELFERVGIPVLVISNLHKTDRIVVRSQKLRGCNVWHCVHGMLAHAYLGNKTGLNRWIKKKKIQQVYNNRQVVVVSEAVGHDLIKQVGVQPSRLVTIYNPFNINEIKQKSQAENPFSDQSYILHVGRFHSVKRHDRLLEAFAIAKLPCKLLLVGQGDEKVSALIKQKIDAFNLIDKVIMAGFHRNPLPIIKGAELVVLSSDSEGLPSVLIEALICGTPVVSTNCPGGVTEIMSGELANYLAEMSSESLAQKLRLAWDKRPLITPELYQQFEQQHIIDSYIALSKK